MICHEKLNQEMIVIVCNNHWQRVSYGHTSHIHTCMLTHTHTVTSHDPVHPPISPNPEFYIHTDVPGYEYTDQLLELDSCRLLVQLTSLQLLSTPRRLQLQQCGKKR